MRLLIIEDEDEIATPLIDTFKDQGFAVDYAADGQKGHNLATINEYDCIILDLNLPKMDGLTLAQKLRSQTINTPILMLTARDAKKDIWNGFETGTDDYLTKPFDLKELILRVQALVKRHSKNQNQVLQKFDLTLNPLSHLVTKAGKVVELNNKEFGILEYLLRNQGQIVSSEQLLEHVWDREIDIFTQTVRTNIKTLRQKIDPKKILIKTLRGAGYVIY